VVLLDIDAFIIALRINGQFPLVISFEALSLFVMSGAGLTLSNFNAEAGDSRLSLRDVPMIMTFIITLC